MPYKKITYYFILFVMSISCSSQKKILPKPHLNIEYHSNIFPKIMKSNFYSLERKDWVELKTLAPSIYYDIKYASNENFVHKAVYPCSKCFLRPEVAKALTKAQSDLQKKGYSLIIYDCYRPLIIQRKLWKMKPDPMYVANPEKGSMHNRGLAVDLSIVDKNGNELDMGTLYDSFSKKAHSDYQQLSDTVLKNRKLLYEVMHKYKMEPIRTEWWHFSYRGKKYPLARWVWDCD